MFTERKKPFFVLPELREPVNQWLCIAFLGLFTFWVTLYYFTEKTQAINNKLTVEFDARTDINY